MIQTYFKTNRLLFAFAMVGLTACGSSNVDAPTAASDVDVVAGAGGVVSGQTGDSTSTGDSSSDKAVFKVNISDRSNLTAAQSAKVDQAVAVLNVVMNSAAFKTAVLNFTYGGTQQFYQNNGLTNQQIYDTLMAGAELYPTASLANHMADMKVKIYYPPWYSVTSAVAFTSTTDDYLNIYSSYFSSASIADLAETLIHEWTHKLGFDHDYNATAARPYSVPYGIGGIVNKLVSSSL